MQLEEGEIYDEESIDYNVLDRPLSLAPVSVIPLTYSSDSSQNDSDYQLPKRQKRNSKLSQSKYNVWSAALPDELALSMDKCEVSATLDKSRNVEAYPYRSASSSAVFNFRETSTLTERSEVGTKRFIRPSRKNSNSEGKGTGRPRLLGDLIYSDSDSNELLAKEIASKLCEPKESLILNIINVLGREKAIALYNKTKKIEAKGGLLVLDHTRKRTSGGVYFTLTRQDRNVTASQVFEIFEDVQFRREANRRRRERKRKKARAPSEDISKPKGCDIEPENPPPSPATDADIIPPLDRSLLSYSDCEPGDEMDVM